MPRDFYETLGVAKGASQDDIKAAYRKLAKELHPDLNGSDKSTEHRFKEVNEAYDVLKDEQKRAAYDRYGHEAFQSGMGARGGTGPGAAGFEFNGNFSDIFDDLFGDFMGARRGSGAANTRGADLRYNLQITLEDAFKGKQETVHVTTSVACDSCSGAGSAGGTKPVTCPACNGAGKQRAQQGFFTVERTCGTCHGMGKIIKDPCKVCAGSGRVHKEKKLSVSIPPGVEEGTRIRLTGEGEAGVRGGQPGDLYIFIHIAPHRLFKRDGANIHCRVPIPFTTATLGGDIEVPTIDGGRVKVHIPEGTQTGHQFRLKTKGMKVMRSQQRGDMYIHATVETPVNLTRKQKDLLREFEKGGSANTSPEAEGFFSKVKEFWGDLRE